MVLTNSGAVFLHIQKTGGTWLREAMTASGVPFRQEGHWHDDHGANLERGYQKFFTVVRNPLAWYASFFADRQRTGWGGDLLLGHDCASTSFEGFVARCYGKRRGFLTELYGRHAKPGVTVLRTESLVDDAASLLRSLGEDFDEAAFRSCKPANASVNRPRHTDRSAIMVIASEVRIFLKYGYKFDDAR